MNCIDIACFLSTGYDFLTSFWVEYEVYLSIFANVQNCGVLQLGDGVVSI